VIKKLNRIFKQLIMSDKKFEPQASVAEEVNKQGSFMPRNGLLPLLQLVLCLAVGVLAIFKPYILQSVPYDWGRMTLEYGKNPTILWLILGQLPIVFLWALTTNPKRTWQWVVVISTLVISAGVWLALSDPPPFLG
jgi:hypothetical protein